ncbi:hypothetical protein HPT27_08010 [Permianibacter sp. IMCC34836]|uniref:hypothetical protein n=1 Tax=Permianibacter fluminis TaxID=2738515 RepID=UPI001557B914|nr:hypothetical protein [Permianibacter fluminis]NQD36966.1 hypothetical protein [Permianibacter fluminis]
MVVAITAVLAVAGVVAIGLLTRLSKLLRRLLIRLLTSLLISRLRRLLVMVLMVLLVSGYFGTGMVVAQSSRFMVRMSHRPLFSRRHGVPIHAGAGQLMRQRSAQARRQHDQQKQDDGRRSHGWEGYASVSRSSKGLPRGKVGKIFLFGVFPI